MSRYSDFLNHLGIDKKQMIASMMSKIPESEKPSKRGIDMAKDYTPEEIKDRLSNIGEAIGNIGLDYITELENIIHNHEYYKNGYNAGKHDEEVKKEIEIFTLQGEVELRDVRIFDLNKKIAEFKTQIEKMKCCANCKFEYRKFTENREKCWHCKHESRVYTEWELDKGIKENEKMTDDLLLLELERLR